MHSFTILPATPETLSDLYALHADATGAAPLLETYRGRVERGEAHLSETLILRAARGVEGTVMFGPAPHPYVFPHLRADAPAAAVTAFLLELRHALSPERQIVLDTSRADVPAGPVLAAGWVLDDTHLIYQTDLTAIPRAADPHVHEVNPEWPEVRAVLAELGRSDLALREGWTLHGLYAADALLALGASGSSGRPGPAREAGIDLIGVRPAVRGLGLGRRLHAHLLGGAAGAFDRHTGGTSADNQAMRRVFGHSGSVHTGTQWYFRQP